MKLYMPSLISWVGRNLTLYVQKSLFGKKVDIQNLNLPFDIDDILVIARMFFGTVQPINSSKMLKKIPAHNPNFEA